MFWIRPSLRSILLEILMNQADLAIALDDIAKNAAKAQAEIVAATKVLADKIAELEAVIAAGGVVDPAVETALAGVKSAVDALDALNPDA